MVTKRRLREVLVCAVVLLMMAGTCIAAGPMLYLQAGTFDPIADRAVAWNSSYPLTGSHYFIVQCSGVVEESWKASLQAAGLQLLAYIPDYAYLVKADSKALNAVRKMSFVRWIGPYLPGYKIERGLLGKTGRFRVTIKLFPGANAGSVVSSLSSLSPVRFDTAGNAMIETEANAVSVQQIAAEDGVAWVEERTEFKLFNDVARGLMRVNDVWRDVGLYGQGQIVSVCDTGLDTGAAGSLHQDLASRLVVAYALGRPGDWSDPNGHGTHVAGSVLGTGAASGSVPASHDYLTSYAGSAPEAQLVFQSVLDSSDGLGGLDDSGLDNIFQQAYDAGARIHTNSWGSSEAGKYKITSQQVDDFCWRHKDMLILFAAGNEGVDEDANGIIDSDSIGAPATAKNCLTVGASENLRATGGYASDTWGSRWGYPEAPIAGDLTSNDPTGMAAFSSRGPTDDGRIKPDISAPGTNILSCRSRAPGAGDGWDGHDSNYVFMGGTSMATPLAAGASALVRQYLVQSRGVASPSSALVKATMMNGALDLNPGQYGAGSTREMAARPNNVEGWGRVDVARSLALDAPRSLEFVDQHTGLTTGQAATYTYSVSNTTVPLNVTLAWTDAPAAVEATRTLVNDLDLTVIAPDGTAYQGNGTTDRINNVETVDVSAPTIGAYIVRVTAYNVPVDSQPYALAANGSFSTTLIQGTVTNAAGAGVRGITVTAGGYTSTTDTSGEYAMGVTPGTYTVTPAKTGWTFDPASRSVTAVENTSVTADFTGTAGPSTVSGRVTETADVYTAGRVESAHPYANSVSQEWTITGPAGATSIQVHFEYIATESGFDYVRLVDPATGSVLQSWDGSYNDITSAPIPGNSVKVRLTSDGSVTGNGFVIDGYTAVVASPVAGAVVTMIPGNLQATTVADGTYTISNVQPGTYALSPSLSGYGPWPVSREITVEPAASITGQDFEMHPVTTITGRILGPSTVSTSNTVTESPHPYTNSYSNTWTLTDPSWRRVRVHFDYISTESSYDYVRVQDAGGSPISSYSGSYSNTWSAWITGSTLKIQLTSDGSVTGQGFRADQIEYETEAAIGMAGVVVTLTPGNVAPVTIAADGTYTISNVPPGDYNIEPTFPDWGFDPARRSAIIQGVALTDQNFTGLPPGAISGSVSVIQTESVTSTTESAHPYADNADQTWQIIGPSGTTSLRLHFSYIDVESNYDYVRVRSSNGTVIRSYTGSYADIWTDWISGGSATINLTSDSSVVENGFVCDAYECVTGGAGVGGVIVRAQPGDKTAMTGADGSYVINSVAVGEHTVAAEWADVIFLPATVDASVASGVTTPNINFGTATMPQPTAVITGPTGESNYLTNSPTINIGGLAMSTSPINSVTWSSDRGQSGACTGAQSWTAADVAISTGVNVITVTMTDSVGVSATDTLTVRYYDSTPGTAWTGTAMVSLPIIPSGADPKPVVGFDQNYWFSFSPSANSYSAYPQPSTWFEPAESTRGRGFWARFAAVPAVPYGELPPQDQQATIHLTPGWNLIGQPFVTAVPWNLDGITVQVGPATPIALRAASAIVRDFAWGWHPDASSPQRGAYYLVADTQTVPAATGVLAPWQGYWIHAIQDCDLIIPAPAQ